MLNLLILSNNIKAESIRKKLQPMLKARIDILGDFDLGLKEVFEKRPTTVLIQEHLDGVSADNVARHIQMLLGKSGPTFILLHDGNPSAKPVKGLFDHVIDLSVPAKPFFKELISKLKLIYGDQWEKLYIPPDSSGFEPVVDVVPVLDSDAANRMVDELLSDLNSENEPIEEKVVSRPTEIAKTEIDKETRFLATKTEEIAALLMEAANESRTIQLSTEEPKAVLSIETPKPQTKEINPNNITPQSRPVSISKTSVTVNPGQNADSLVVVGTSPLPQDDVGRTESSQPDLSKISDDILLSFEKNYRTDSSHWKSVAVIGGIVACILAGGWYLLSNNLAMFAMAKKNQEAPAASIAQPVKPAIPANIIQQPLSTSTKSVNEAKATLPSFVPSKGRDLTFSGKGPGWERYLSESVDIRLFRSEGKMMAIQVLGVKGVTISDSYLKNVLKEVMGNDQLKQLSVNQKHGLKMQRYSLNPKGELLIYRDKASGLISAFVLSLD
jgi:hypothetical protein